MRTINIVGDLNVEADKEEASGIISFLERYPNADDADRQGRVFVYKPQGWPEVLQPQYDNAPTHILAVNGYWSPIHWQRLQDLSYDHPNWKQRLLFTHWKRVNSSLDVFCFQTADQFDPQVPKTLDWQSVDWSPIKTCVREATLLMQHGPMADRLKVAAIHQELKRWLDADDPFYLNQWLPNYRMHGWALDPDDA